MTSIGNYAFEECSGLTSVTFHCKDIKDWFKGYSNIKIVVIGDEVTSIGSSAFSGCSGLYSVIIGSGVTSIGNNAFNNTKLKKIFWLTNTPPSGYENAKGVVNYVSNNQFNSIKDAIVYPFLSSMFEVDGVVYVPVSPSERTCDAIDCTYDKSIIKTGSTVSYKGVAMKVKNIMPYVFCNNKRIKDIKMEIDGNIYMSAFADCDNLETIVIGQTAGFDAEDFRGCFIGNNVAEIGDNTFDGCKSIKNIIIADREDELKLGSSGSNSLFAACPLDSVYIGGNISYQTEQKYGYSPFYRNTSLRTVVITDKETVISENEFYGCTNLQNFTVGDGVESFGNWAFSGCSSLKSLSFGSRLKSIGKEAFSDCVSVTSIVSRASIPPVCDTQALDDINKWECKLTVPKGYIASYQSADQWKDFFFMEEGEGGSLVFKLTYMIGNETYKEVEIEYGATIPAEPQPDGDYVRFEWVGVPETMPAHNVIVYADFETGIRDVMALQGVRCIYGPNGKRISKLQRGLNIVVMNDGSIKKVYVK